MFEKDVNNTKKRKQNLPIRLANVRINRETQLWPYVVGDFVRLVLSDFALMRFCHLVNFLAILNWVMLSLQGGKKKNENENLINTTNFNCVTYVTPSMFPVATIRSQRQSSLLYQFR